jgi:hypothetical protein
VFLLIKMLMITPYLSKNHWPGGLAFARLVGLICLIHLGTCDKNGDQRKIFEIDKF